MTQRLVAGRCDGSVTSWGSIPETLRNWVQQAEIDAGERAGTTTAGVKRIAELEREAKELRRTNDIVQTAPAFSAAAELDRRSK